MIAGSGTQLLAAVVAASCLGGTALRANLETHLFTSWYGVDSGAVVLKVDRTNLDPQALETLEEIQDWYHQTLAIADGNYPPERINLPTGVVLRAEVASKSAPWLVRDKPWETGEVFVQRVIFDRGLYRVWYSASTKSGKAKVRTMPNGKKKLAADDAGGGGGLCYMESRDAVQWVKPSLGLVEFHGSKDNNIVTRDPRIGVAIFIDPTAPPTERYKSVGNIPKRLFDPATKEPGPVLGGAVSPDGLHWRALPEPLWSDTFNGDGSPEVHVDSFTHDYVLYTRANYPRRRSIARAETRDFRHWPVPTIILTPGADENPAVDYYDNPFLTYPGCSSSQFLLVAAYHHDTDQVDLQLATSMDGDGWSWLTPRAVVRLGAPRAWDGGMLWGMGDLVRLPDGRLAAAFTGDARRHNEYWRAVFERSYQNTPTQIAWALWEDGRIAGLEAKTKGEFTTLAMKASGAPIEVNARTGFSGSVQVDVYIEEKGGPYPTLALRSEEMTGDLRWRPLVFRQESLSQMAGKNIRLRFHLYDAKVFGVRGEGLEWARSTRMSPPQL